MPPWAWMQSWVTCDGEVGYDDGGDVAGEVGGVVALVEGGGGVPDGGARLLEGDAHPGALVLDALELADRASELDADLGVLGRRRDGPGDDAGRLGAEDDGSDGAGALGGETARARWLPSDDERSTVPVRSCGGRRCCPAA